MKIQERSLDELKKIIMKERDFKEINEWKFKHITLGEMQHTYKISKGNRIYFLKELKIHEAQMEYFLSQLKLKHLPFSLYPNLLKEKILIRKFIDGKMLRNKKIDMDLIKDFALMRNKMNDKKFFDKHNPLKLKNYSQKDDGFYERGLRANFAYASRVLRKLDKYNLKEVNDFWNILNHIKKQRKEIIQDYVSMPFAKQHQDFREDNIIVGSDGKQKLIDWGSSYGYNQFMFDVAPFLINNPKAFKAYIRISDNCNGVTQKQLERWLYVALAARFLGVIRWRLHPNEKRANTKENCRKFLKYEYNTYKHLLN
jgi:thiamine kinase-like enzyme|tara:strand:- start:659 stop:1594 length:936 start_codon:yes stop_codon:yes gene_type:complete